jgi:ligand-binding sensor domain-containing protein/signal transduction histidine kinase
MKPYRIDSWQVDDGLPQSSVTSIVQAHDGYLWLGTFGGLVRFDGAQFKVFKPNNASNLPSSRILSLFDDQRGRLWIGTEEGYLAQYAAGEFHVCSPPGWAKLSGYIQGFAESPDRKLWLISPQNELIRVSADQRVLSSTNSELLQTNVNSIAGDSLGQVWTSTDKGIAVWENGRSTEILKLGRSDALNPAVLAGSLREGCWIAADGRLRKFTRAGCVTDYGLFPWSKGSVVRMLEDHDGQVWVGTYGSGLYCYDTNGMARQFSIEDGLPGGFIRSLCEDREGNIWVGTDGYGLARIKPVVFQSYGRKQGLMGDAISSVCEGAEGELWIGMIGDGLDRLKNGVIQHYGTAQGLPNDYVWAVFYDRDQVLWVGTWGGGLCRLEGNRFVPFANPGECGGIVCALYQDSKGSLWVGQQRAKSGIVQVRDGRPMVLDLPSQFTGTDVRSIIEDREGNLWIGTQGDGLYRIKDGRQTRFDRRNGLSNDSVRSLYVDDEGVLWIGTYGGGLNRFKEGKFISFTTREGLVSDELGFITEDGCGNLWCSSQGGVFRVGKKELDQFAEGKSSWIRCLPFTKSDGLPSLECTGGCQPSGCKTKDGRLWFPTVRGLAVVDPANITVNRLSPPVAIEQVVIEGRERNLVFDAAHAAEPDGPAAPLKIAPGVQRLEIHYTALSLTEPMKVRFKYKLEGLDEDWVEAGARRTVNFSHLQPGTYRFVVQGCNNDGIWNEQGASLALIVLPHFWQTWWFRVLCLTSVLALLAGIYELRLVAERKLTRVRLRIASDLHDEVGSNLGSIALLSEMIPKTGEEVDEIRRVSLQTVNSLRDIVWFLDPAADNMAELILRLKETARTMLPGIPFDFVSEGETDSVRPSLHLRRNVLPMVKEVLHNVARHAHAKRVSVVVRVTSQQFQISVTDDGIGFDESRIRRGNGLKNLRRRAADVRGTLEIQSRPGNGTRFTFTAPIT